MKRFKRTLSVLLIFTFLFSLVPSGLVAAAGNAGGQELYMRFDPAVYNPNEGKVTIKWTFEKDHQTRVVIYPINGNEADPIRVLAENEFFSGGYVENTLEWDGKDDNGDAVPNGIYRVAARPLEEEWNMFAREASLIVTSSPEQDINIAPDGEGSYILYGSFYPEDDEVAVEIEIDGKYNRSADTDDSMWMTTVELYENETRRFRVTKTIEKEVEKTDAEGNTYIEIEEEEKYVGELVALEYQVKKDDTLGAIAGHFYNNSRLYPQIAELNNIPDPNNIFPGQKLIILDPEQEGDLIRPENPQEPLQAQLGGANTQAGQSADPVNLATGNYFYQHQDLAISGTFPIKFSRIYLSQGNHHGILGINWHNSFDIHLNILSDSSVEAVFADGHREVFTLDDSPNYKPPAGSHKKLRKNGDETFTLSYRNKWKYHFSQGGRLAAIQDPNGNKTDLLYDNLLLREVRNDSGHMLFQYDRLGRLRQVVDQAGRSVSYDYDSDYNLTDFTDPEGNTIQYQYDRDHRMRKVISPNKKGTIENIYNDQGQVIRQVAPNGGITYFNYQGGTTTVTDAKGYVTTYRHDGRLRLVKKIDPFGYEESYQYTENDEIKLYMDKKGNSTSFEYDGNGNLKKVVNALGQVTTYEYDADNNLKAVYLANNQTYNFNYDGQGNLTEILNPYGKQVSLNYNITGLVENMVQPNGGISKFNYQDNGNLDTIEDALGHITQLNYDAANRLKAFIDPKGNEYSFTYDDNGRLVTSTDPLGNTITIEYNANGKPIKYIDQENDVTRYYYDTADRLKEEVDPLNGTTTFEYDLLGNITAVTDAEGNTINYTYDGLSRVKNIEDAAGYLTEFKYDANGNVKQVINPRGGTTVYEYDAANQMIKQVDPEGVVTHYSYNEMGQLKQVQDVAGNKTVYEYDEIGRLKSVADSLGNATKYEYNDLNQVEKVIQPNGAEYQYNYNLLGNLESVIDPAGNQISWQYDANGNVKKAVDELGNATEYDYDSLNRVKTITDAKDNVRQFHYSATGLLERVINEKDNSTWYSYDALGRLKKVTDALGYTTSYQYDKVGNLKEVSKVQEQPETVKEAVYARLTLDLGVGTVSQGEDTQNIIETVYESVYESAYDTSGDSDPLAGDLDNSFLNEVYSWFDSEKIQKTEYRYDKRYQLREIEDALGNITYYDYDANGNVEVITDRDGYSTSYSYDLANRPTGIEYADGRKVSFSYNNLGQMNNMTDWLGSYTFEYDPVGRINKVIDALNHTTRYLYTPLGQRDKIIYPDGSEVDYEYNRLGQLTGVTDGLGKKTTYGYDAVGNITERILPNGTKTIIDYVPLSQVKQLSHLDPEGKITDMYQIEYDKAGNKKKITKQHFEEATADPEEDESLSFTYDALDQLRTVTDANGSRREYLYDSIGNRTAMLESSSGETQDSVFYRYNQLNQLTQITDEDGDTKDLSYDKRGNLNKIQSGGNVFNEYIFDSTNRLAQVVNKHKEKTSYTYNGLGQRVKTLIELDKNKGGRLSKDKEITDAQQQAKPGFDQQHKRDRMETTYALDMLSPTQNILLSYGDQVQTQRFTYGLEVLSMHFQSLNDHDNGWVPEGDETTYSGEWETLYYLQDELGSIMKVVGANGKKSAHYNYDEFGRPLGAVKFDPNWPGPDNTLGYTGYDYDHYAGLYYANARYYMPEIGRFISEDPWNGSLFNPNTLNKYPYVLNNPMKYVDPLGLRPLDWPQFMQSNSGSTSGLGKAAAKAQWQGETAGISTPNQNGPTVTPIELVVKDNHNLFEKYLRWRLNQHPQLVVNENGELRYTEEEFDKMLNMIPVLGVENLSKNVIKKAGKGLLQKLKQLFSSKGAGNSGGIVTKNGIKIEGFTGHGVDRAIGDGFKRAGVKPDSILDALKNPLKTNNVVTDSLGRNSQRFIGKTAEVVINPDTGKIISVNPTSSSKAAKLLRELEGLK
ncbi:DUF6531 domain-containing protein [Metallumcola ferriviriculae]|uniref:DUF6531 domain-containing protein n=1 Tax=Metallumcola ferriviriculae TaxID=3039180 RepID=A0AAU0UT12_9FIRM|nr:DUF6531 domain-containing protein [Desulfitibacteraceae bacterium MK1]